MNSSGRAAVYRAALDRANQGDLPGYPDVYSDDVVFCGVSLEPMDKAGVGAFHENSYAAFPGTADMLGLLIQVGAVPPPGG